LVIALAHSRAPNPGPIPPYRAIPSALIQRGSHTGLPKKPKPDRKRFLYLRQVQNLTNAVLFSDRQGQQLISGMTVLWSHLPGFKSVELPRLQTRLFKRITQWAERNGFELCAVWVRENGKQKKEHLHVIWNVPVNLLGDLERFILADMRFSKGGVEMSRGGYGRFGMRTQKMRLGKLRYMLKAYDHRHFRYYLRESQNTGEILGIQHRGTDGALDCKRAGTTQNIGPAARKRAGWQEIKGYDALGRALCPDA